MTDEVEMLQCQVRYLENENRALRQNLRDEFAKAALPEIMRLTESLGNVLAPDEGMRATAIIAYRIADAMLEARKS